MTQEEWKAAYQKARILRSTHAYMGLITDRAKNAARLYWASKYRHNRFDHSVCMHEAKKHRRTMVALP